MEQQNNQKNIMRFSDEKLYEFHKEFRAHVDRCEKRFNDGDAQFNELLTAQKNNTDAITALIEETRGIVELHRDLQGATRVGMSLQKFILWLTKWGAIGVGLATLLSLVLKLIEQGVKWPFH